MEQKDIIYASSLKGFCTVETCWQFIHDISLQLEQLHARGKPHGAVDLRHVAIEGKKFLLLDNCSDKRNATDDIWKLAASAYELMLGTPVLNGLGEAAQKAGTPIPSLPGNEVEALNSLLHKCMDYKKSSRPVATAIRRVAATELERLSAIPRRSRIHTNVSNKETLEKYDRSWPEHIVASVLCIIFLLTGALQAHSQETAWNKDEATTVKLLNATLLLRERSEKNWNEAKNELSKRLGIFTLMDELKDYANDCALIEKNVKSFGLNRIVKELKAGKRVQNTGKGLLDGSDSRFNYSIYEKGIKKGRTSTYRMSGRSGKQLFIIVPYSAAQPYSTELSIEGGVVYTPHHKDENGITYYIVDTNDGPAGGENLKLKISNEGNSNAAFVVINHNYRNR